MPVTQPHNPQHTAAQSSPPPGRLSGSRPQKPLAPEAPTPLELGNSPLIVSKYLHPSELSNECGLSGTNHILE